MSELYGKPWDQIKAELGALVFHNPNGGWEFPAFWALTLWALALLGNGAYAVGKR